MTETTNLEELALRLTDAQRRALIDAKPHDDGEVYARAYSVPDHLTKSYRVYGRGDPLNPIAIALRNHLENR